MKIAGLIWLMLGSVVLYAQQEVQGRVLDRETNEALVGAHVYLLNHWRTGSITNELGVFTIELPQTATADSMVFSYIGYEEQVLPLGNNLEVKLAPKAAVWEVVVIRAKPLIAEEFKYLELTKLEVYTNPAAKADPILAINSLPAATTTDESANISLRGSSPLETGLYLNNVPVYDAVRYSQLNGIGTFSLFNTSIIKKVTVFPGNPPLEYGNATSGIIALSTDETIVGSSTNSLIVSLANIGYSREQKVSENQSLKIFSNYQPSGAIKALNEKSLENIRSFESGDLGIYWYGAANKFQWKVFNYSLLEGYEFNFQHPSFQGSFDQNKKRSFATASLERSGNQGTLSLNLGGSVSKGDFKYSNVKFEVLNRDFFAGWNYAYSRSKYQIKTGLSYDHRFSEVGGTFHRFDFALGPDHPIDSIQLKVQSQSLESFVYFKYYLSKALAVGTGLRKNLPINDQNSYWSKQVNFSYNQGPWVITLGAGTYHKYGLLENSGGLLTVKSQQLVMDAKYVKPKGSVTGSVFFKESTIDATSYDLMGVELYTQIEFNSKLDASLSLSYLHAKTADSQPYPYDLSYFLKGNLAYRPAANWTLEALVSARDGVPYLPVAGANFNIELQSFEPIYQSTSVRRPDYLSLGISLSKLFAISDKISIIGFATVNNLTNHENVRDYNYSFDYQSRTPSFFSQRTGYMGAVINF